MRAALHLIASACAVVWAVAAVAASEPLPVTSPSIRRDPFALPSAAREGTTPVDPLQRHSLAELTLVGTAHGVDPPRALIEDPEGLGFVVVAGSVIGVEGGKVVEIHSGRVVVEPSPVAEKRVVLRLDRDANASSASR